MNDMKELLHKAWLFGAGVFDFTKDKVEALVQEMVRRGEITQQESSEAVKQLLAKAQEAQQAMVAKVKELTKGAVDEIKVAKAADLEALEARVAALEEALKQALEVRGQGSGNRDLYPRTQNLEPMNLVITRSCADFTPIPVNSARTW